MDYEQVAQAFNLCSRVFVYFNDDTRSCPFPELFATDRPIERFNLHLIVAKDPGNPQASREYLTREITADELYILVQAAIIAEGLDEE
jgi:hypothetical protein